MMRQLLRHLFGVYESAPLQLMTRDDAVAWAREHPCADCGLPIDVETQDFRVINDSVAGITAHHHEHPSGGA